ncbi:MAG TPA: FecR domain-containing protein [Methylomirabilota bacterium]|nr:FecR domain-containing protein [Methylomirabilota bacterium]
MKPFGISKVIACGMVAAAALLASEVQAKTVVNKAVVRAVRGSAQYSAKGQSQWQNVKVGMQFPPNTVIRTAPDSTVDLFLNQNGPVVRVTSDTSLGLDKLSYETGGVEDTIETQLDLRNGRILGNVKKLAAASRYEIKTPRGVAAIRGTEYDISANGVMHCVSGQFQVAYVLPNGQVQLVTVNAGQTAVPPSGNQAPQVSPTTGRPEAGQINTAIQGFRNETGGFTPANNPAPVPTPGVGGGATGTGPTGPTRTETGTGGTVPVGTIRTPYAPHND